MDILILPETFSADVLALSGDLIDSLLPLVILVIGLILGFFVFETLLLV